MGDQEKYTSGRTYIIKNFKADTRVMATSRAETCVKLNAQNFEISTGTRVEEIEDLELDDLKLTEPGQLSSVGTGEHMLTRSIRGTREKYAVVLIIPWFAFTTEIGVGLLIFVVIWASLPCLWCCFQGLIRVWRKKKDVSVSLQTVEEVIRRNVLLHASYVPASKKEKERKARQTARVAEMVQNVSMAEEVAEAGGEGEAADAAARASINGMQSFRRSE